jgi:hypothetical protein
LSKNTDWTNSCEQGLETGIPLFNLQMFLDLDCIASELLQQTATQTDPQNQCAGFLSTTISNNENFDLDLET